MISLFILGTYVIADGQYPITVISSNDFRPLFLKAHCAASSTIYLSRDIKKIYRAVDVWTSREHATIMPTGSRLSSGSQVFSEGRVH